MVQYGRQRNCILNRLIGPLPSMRQHRVGGVSQQGQAPPRPGLKRLSTEEPPSNRCFHLTDDGLNKWVPAPELPGERGGFANRRPGFLQRLVGREKADVIDELVGPDGKDQKMLAGPKPVAHST